MKVLGEEVRRIMVDYCSFCGACYSICPVNAITLGEDNITIDESRCIDCHLCEMICPVVNKFTVKPSFLKGYIARTKLPEVAKRAQDGGAVTSILLAALETKIISGAILSKLSPLNPLKPVPFIAKTREEIIEAAGSWYFASPVLSLLNDLKNDLDKMAIVGVPCQLNSLKLFETYLGKKIALKIGLFCMETFKYETFLKEIIEKNIGISPSEAIKMNIKKNYFFIVTRKGLKKGHIHVDYLKTYVRESCLVCNDLTGAYSDISAGGMGVKEGWTVILIRSPKGMEVFENAVDMGYLDVKPLPSKVKKIINIVEKRKLKRYMENIGKIEKFVEVL